LHSVRPQLPNCQTSRGPSAAIAVHARTCWPAALYARGTGLVFGRGFRHPSARSAPESLARDSHPQNLQPELAELPQLHRIFTALAACYLGAVDIAPPPFTVIPAHLAQLTIEEAWARIDAWLSAHHPALAQRLAGPASEREIAQLEDAVGARLPDDYKASLRIHAGGRTLTTSRGDAIYATTPFAEFDLLPPEVVLASMKRLEPYAAFGPSPHAVVAPTVRPTFYDRGWIPVVNVDQDFAVIWCIDTVPTERAADGQIVEMVTSGGDADRRVLWPGFRELLIGGLLKRIEGETVDPDALEESGWIEFVAEPGG
jgi:cell wall assembly regulator SMI1